MTKTGNGVKRRQIMGDKGFLCVLVSLVLLLCGCLREESEEVWALRVGDRLPEFAVTLLDMQGADAQEHAVCTSDLIGHVTLICLFDTSCGDCRRELPELQKIYENETFDAVEFLCIPRGGDGDEVRDFWTKHGLTMPVSLPDASVYHLFAQAFVPRIFISDSEGIIRASFCEEIPSELLISALRSIH